MVGYSPVGSLPLRCRTMGPCPSPLGPWALGPPLLPLSSAPLTWACSVAPSASLRPWLSFSQGAWVRRPRWSQFLWVATGQPPGELHCPRACDEGKLRVTGHLSRSPVTGSGMEDEDGVTAHSACKAASRLTVPGSSSRVLEALTGELEQGLAAGP